MKQLNREVPRSLKFRLRTRTQGDACQRPDIAPALEFLWPTWVVTPWVGRLLA